MSRATKTCAEGVLIDLDDGSAVRTVAAGWKDRVSTVTGTQLSADTYGGATALFRRARQRSGPALAAGPDRLRSAARTAVGSDQSERDPCNPGTLRLHRGDVFDEIPQGFDTVLTMQPIASASPEELIELLTPTVQRYPG
ncbi:hypothetical protein ACH4E8_33970 [Streptomyces sp. NPDC017979]|uniref:hypothetical protein n=1 Tax=Streptomyces sp. NPDC017979 TaxID=3365024 RepID=UPI0037A2F011